MVQLATQSIGDKVRQQRHFFSTGQTRQVSFRIAQLKALRRAITEHQASFVQALQADLGKPEFEAYATEIMVVREIDHALQHIQTWVKPRKVPAAATLLPASARIQPEPLGVVLIIAPWNYPLQLLVSPLIGAIAAGNCALLKPSEHAPHTSQVFAKVIAQTFDPAYITVVEGGVETSQALLEVPFDHILFTGGPAIGKAVMAAAAKHLTPVTLELGGKSPCVIDADVDIETTARRIVWGKFINAGQTCIAPDYLLVDRQIKPQLLQAICRCLQEFYGDDPAQSPDYGRIVSDRHFARLAALLQDGEIVAGGQTNAADRYIAPTVLDQVDTAAPVMQEEIFGPILPVLDFSSLDEAIACINSRPKPLALYVFSRNKALVQRLLQATSSGTACINDVILQVAAYDLPFGGVGPSGMGSYHGQAGFDTFSHRKSILYKSFWFDLKWRYAPYVGKLKFLQRLIG